MMLLSLPREYQRFYQIQLAKLTQPPKSWYLVPMGSEHLEISPTRRRVLETLKRRGEATADQLADDLETTPGAVRQHLAALRSADLVVTRPSRGQTGRPADVYRCTALTEPLFAIERDLAVEILDDIHDEDPALVERIFDRRRRRMVDATRDGLAGKPIGERVAALTDHFDAHGYLADFDETSGGAFRIHLHNCPIWNVADRFEHACNAELGFIGDILPDAEVTRIEHKSDHCSTCAYQISPVAAQPRHPD